MEIRTWRRPLFIFTIFVALLSSGCGGDGGSAAPPPPQAPVIASFTATPPSIPLGQSSTLSWTTSGATSLSIDQGVGPVSGTGVSVSPGSTTTYTLTARGLGGNSTAAATVTVQPVNAITFDCTAIAACPQLTVAGDAADTSSASGFYGNLDPTLRRDPGGSHPLYFMYSFPMVVPGGVHTPTIEIHLASSTDQGATWNFLSKVWPYRRMPDGNYLSHEVSNFAAQNLNGTVTWYAISHSYEVPPGGSPSNPNNALYVEPLFTQSTLYVLVSAGNPSGLASPADSMILNCGGTTSAYSSPSNPNLTAISGDAGAVTWREPALIVQGDVLYLAAQSADANGTFGYIGIFAAKTSGKMSSWNWKYLGKLFGPNDAAQALPSAAKPVFTEIDLTQRADGQIIAIMTAMDLSTQQKYGSRTADVATLGNYDSASPPAMVRDGQGRLIFTGQFTATDLNAPPNQGPGASTYEATEGRLGVLIARRGIQPNVHGFTFATGQHPQ